MAKERRPKGRKARPLVVERLEMVSKSVFKKYYPLIAELVGSSHGIYALYDDNELYYVGKSTDLRKRVRAHLRDRHLASWTHFSLYLVRNAQHISDIESLLVRITNPKGNRQAPRRRTDSTLLRKLRSLIKQRQREELEGLFGARARGKRSRDGAGRLAAERRMSISGLVTKRTALYRSYRGTEYKAYLSPAGTITFEGKRYDSPSAAAAAVTGGRRNGWKFWYIRDSNGDWVRLEDYNP